MASERVYPDRSSQEPPGATASGVGDSPDVGGEPELQGVGLRTGCVSPPSSTPGSCAPPECLFTDPRYVKIDLQQSPGRSSPSVRSHPRPRFPSRRPTSHAPNTESILAASSIACLCTLPFGCGRTCCSQVGPPAARQP